MMKYIPISLRLMFLMATLLFSFVAYLGYYFVKSESATKIQNAFQYNNLETKLLAEQLNSQINLSISNLKNLVSLEMSYDIANKISVIEKNNNIKDLIVVNFSDGISSVYGDRNSWLKEISENYVKLQKQELLFLKKGSSIALMFLDEKNNKKYIYGLTTDLDVAFSSHLEIILDNKILYSNIDDNIFFKEAYEGSISKNALTESREYKVGENSYISTYYKLPFNIVLINSISKDVIMEEVYESIQKMILVSLLCFGVGIILILMISKSFSTPLEKIVHMAESISKGNWNVRINNKPKNEIGFLAHSIEKMAKKLKDSLDDKEKKIKLENEVKIASTIQKTLIPEKEQDYLKANIYSFYKPANECGGDFFNYYISDEKLVVFIGDATGHGLSSALITVSARSALAISEKNQETNPLKILNTVNDVVRACSKEILMTGFIAVVDFNKKTITYANAGHNIPWLMGDNIKSLTGKGFRLGETEKFECEVKEIEYKDGDSLFLYTDGLVEVIRDGKKFDKKAVREVLDKKFENSKKLEEAFVDFNKGVDIPDDACFISIKLKGAS